ncbi:MAG: M20/M25/M40 family metallo-hydrolase, partial [Candidatus Cloacimonetes bacterium]|nr:M20/M25/M40 family metallo-hydrolase [Candidatus Cloacimonadota bacterium]
MKRVCFLLALIITLGVLYSQNHEPVTDIMNLLPLINADTLEAHVQHLQDYQTRFALADNHFEIAGWIQDQFESYGFTNTWMQEYPHYGTTQYNVIATIPGSLYPEIYIIVGAHYDSQNPEAGSMVFAPGADDNASGTAGMLEMARVMKIAGYQPKCTIRFIAISAEEGWGWGSEEYCDYAISENHNIRLMVNLDMISINQQTSTEFLVVPYTGSEEFCAEAIRISDDYSAYQPIMGDLDIGSDSIIFSQNGFDAVFFFERYINPYYHTSNDIIDHLDFMYASEIVRAATATTAVFANQPIPVPAVSVHDTGTGNSLFAQWSFSPDPEVSHYAVYYGTGTDSMIFWQNVNGNQCTISGLIEGQFYNIAVAAVSEAGYSAVRIFSGGTPLSTPTTPSVLIDSPGTGAITITWTANPELDIASYKVYRSLGSQGTSLLIATVPSPQTSYTDTDVTSTEEYYYYCISAIDNQGNQSQLSEALISRMVSLDRGIYVIDESKNFSGSSPF